MGQALVFGLLGSSALVIGGALGAYWRAPHQISGVLLAFASGTLISALAFELFPEAVHLGGLAIALASLVLGVLPGPGTLTFFVGLAMISGEFYPVARLLDWAEVRARKLGRWVGGVWRASAAGKALVISVAAIGVAAVLYVAYRLLFGG